MSSVWLHVFLTAYSWYKMTKPRFRLLINLKYCTIRISWRVSVFFFFFIKPGMACRDVTNSSVEPSSFLMFTTPRPNAPSAPAWLANKLTGGRRIGWQQRRSDSWETPPGSLPGSYGYSSQPRNRRINSPTVTNRNAQAVRVCDWKSPFGCESAIARRLCAVIMSSLRSCFGFGSICISIRMTTTCCFVQSLLRGRRSLPHLTEWRALEEKKKKEEKKWRC